MEEREILVLTLHSVQWNIKIGFYICNRRGVMVKHSLDPICDGTWHWCHILINNDILADRSKRRKVFFILEIYYYCMYVLLLWGSMYYLKCHHICMPLLGNLDIICRHKIIYGLGCRSVDKKVQKSLAAGGNIEEPIIPVPSATSGDRWGRVSGRWFDIWKRSTSGSSGWTPQKPSVGREVRRGFFRFTQTLHAVPIRWHLGSLKEVRTLV